MEPRHILVVDDDPDIRAVITINLTRLGHRVSTAADGRAATAAVASTKFDLVITDLLMPDKEGLELIKELRATSASMPIIAMSGGGRNAPGGYLDIARRFGAQAVLKKPFASAELAKAINGVFQSDKIATP